MFQLAWVTMLAKMRANLLKCDLTGRMTISGIARRSLPSKRLKRAFFEEWATCFDTQVVHNKYPFFAVVAQDYGVLCSLASEVLSETFLFARS